eukprot:CAMPEP_0172579308 /NCGR_PEP_ID=MMETSP1067-20121228/139178_1 /TAXON_ID=265564 ORGANISM="Thalassiosira punctigera, Strain Tpunct2005C2" /NCGR_SAMPLE_ID=MMETSP1067 /ASSEMBLY_ACC=CAM_ASM_000444 /LENGTH=1233 /DNA_ID=CAMNT_0013372023 /DNA_START=206 /DNA_END=3907 /DNA_ORIENTATION=-
MSSTSVEGGFEMPSLNVRNSIANKVAAKKTAKGYTLSDESCDVCEMRLMTLKGKSECKVCPAIKKWVQRKNDMNKGAVPDDVPNEAREATETVEQEPEEVRDEAPADLVDADEKPCEVVVETVEKEPEVCDGPPFDSVGADEKPCEVTELKASISEASSDLENPSGSVEEEGDDDDDDTKLVSSESADSEDSGRYISKSESDESEDTDAIRARARQIIMDARGGSASSTWMSSESTDSEDSNDDDDGSSMKSSMKSSTMSWDEEKMTFSKGSIEESNIQDRAGEIILQARKSLEEEEETTLSKESTEESDIQERAGEIILQARKSLEEENGIDLRPEMMTPRVEVEDVKSTSAEESIVAEGVSSGSYESSNSTTKSSSDDEVSVKEQSSGGVGSYEAAVVIQSAARKYLAKCEEDKQEQEHEMEEAAEETKEETGGNRYVSLCVSTPTEDDGGEDGDQDIAQDSVEDVQVEVGFDSFQEVANTNSLKKDTCVAVGEEPEPAAVADKEPEPVTVVQDSESVTAVQEPESVTAVQEPEPVTVNHGPEPFTAHQECEAIADEQEPEPVVVEVPESKNGIVPQQHPVEVPVSDYAAVAQREPISVTEPVLQKEKVLTPGANRGLFAKLACKFDDAVTDAMSRVHSIVTCNVSNEENGFESGGFGDAFDAEHNDLLAAPSNCGEVQYGGQAAPSSVSKYDTQVMLLTMRGWRVTNASCHRCNKVLMMLPENGQVMCAGCDDVQVGPEPMVIPQYPNVHPMHVAPGQQHFAHYAPPRPEHDANYAAQLSVANNAHMANQMPVPRAPPRPETVVNRPPAPRPEFAISHAATPSQLYMIEMNRRLQMGWVAMNHGCPYCNSQLMRKPNDDIDHCLACGPIFTQPSQTIATPSMQSFTSSTPLGSRQVPLRDVTASHYGAAAAQTKMTVEPPTMPKTMNQAHPAPASSKPPLPTSNVQDKKNQAFAHNQAQMMQNAHNEMMMQSARLSFDSQMMPPQAQMMQTVSTPSQLQMMQNAHNQMMMQSARLSFDYQMMQADSTPSHAQMMQNLMMQMQLDPNHNNHNQMTQVPSRDQQWAQGDDCKENESGGANVSASEQLEATKHRIEDAKKFIMSRSRSRAMTPLTGIPPMYNMAPGSVPQGNPQMKNLNPAQAGIFRPQPIPQGAQASPQVMRQMGSLISPGEGPNSAHGAQQMSTATPTHMRKMMSNETESSVGAPAAAASTLGSQNDGYSTPEMPGRVFFA